MSKVDRILEITTALFMRYGIRRVSMDDVAKEAGVSKKTLYSYFNDKKELVFETLNRHFNSEQKHCSATFEQIEHPVAQILELSQYVLQQLKSTNPVMVQDLKKFFPRSWELFRKYRQEYVMGFMIANLSKGQSLNLYRKNFHPEIIARVYVNNISLAIEQDTVSANKLLLSETISEIIRYHLYGICTPKGIQYFEENINKI